MLTAKRMLLGLLLLGVLGMHALVSPPGTPPAHHGGMASSSVGRDHAIGHDAASSPLDATGHHGDTGTHRDHPCSALALCLALLLGLAVAAAGGRRTTWVSVLDRALRRLPLPLPPALRDRTPVPRFTVMRC